MDPLVLAAGTALVTAMATDGWTQARDAAVDLWRRVHPQRVPAIQEELEEVRGELLLAREAGDHTTEHELVVDWQRRLHRLLNDDPNLSAEIRRVLDDQLLPLLPTVEQTTVQEIVQHATASDNAMIFQAGRDMHNIGRGIGER
ncbi:hypothetical protein ACFXG4_07485 [Nocardia sp. NPDC059246]|uniref:hypothetical protein n=1 Tax=unclassified Nocardia TaxID=2637762 RepID=UPI0036949544